MREIYRRLLILGVTWGVTRQPTETPHEYLTRLGHQDGRREGDAALITTPYAQARYGARPARCSGGSARPGRPAAAARR